MKRLADQALESQNLQTARKEKAKGDAKWMKQVGNFEYKAALNRITCHETEDCKFHSNPETLKQTRQDSHLF